MPKTSMHFTYDEGNRVAKKPKLDIPLSEQVLMSTIPYHSIEYEEQVSYTINRRLILNDCTLKVF